jgi:hypothetical protein
MSSKRMFPVTLPAILPTLLPVLLAATLLSSPILMQAGTPAALPQQESVADAARKAQAEKKLSKKSAVVVTNDTLDTIKGTVSVVGREPAPPADADKAAADKDKAPAEVKIVKDEAYWRKQFAEAHKKLDGDAHELDILQREYNLKQQQFYSDPNVAMREQFTRADLTDNKAKIDEKTTVVEQDKKAISDLEDELQKAGGDVAWSR